MIPYDELVRALSEWRARNGLPTEPAVGLFEAGVADLGALAEPIAPPAMPEDGAGYQGEEIFVAETDESVDEAAITDEAAVTGEDADDLALATDNGFDEGMFADDATAIGQVPEEPASAFVDAAAMPDDDGALEVESAAPDPEAAASADDIEIAASAGDETEIAASAGDEIALGEDDDFDEEQAWAAALARANQAEDEPAQSGEEVDLGGTEVGDSLIVDEVPDPDRS